MRKRKFLIVNADDFGLTSAINRGVIETHRGGIVTSASLMVRGPAAAEAAGYAKANPELSVGLHFDVEEWRCRDGNWEVLYQVADRGDAIALRAEFERQLAAFETLMGRPPTHLDSHQHVHVAEPTRTLLGQYAEQLHAPLRRCHPAITYDGSFYGQTSAGEPYPAGISPAGLIKTIRSLPAGWTEMGCHPGYVERLDSVYRSEREEELRVLCCTEVRAALKENGVELRSFRDFQSKAKE